MPMFDDWRYGFFYGCKMIMLGNDENKMCRYSYSVFSVLYLFAGYAGTGYRTSAGVARIGVEKG